MSLHDSEKFYTGLGSTGCYRFQPPVFLVLLPPQLFIRIGLFHVCYDGYLEIQFCLASFFLWDLQFVFEDLRSLGLFVVTGQLLV